MDPNAAPRSGFLDRDYAGNWRWRTCISDVPRVTEGVGLTTSESDEFDVVAIERIRVTAQRGEVVRPGSEGSFAGSALEFHRQARFAPARVREGTVIVIDTGLWAPSSGVVSGVPLGCAANFARVGTADFRTNRSSAYQPFGLDAGRAQVPKDRSGTP